jgi:hypothetical protein
MCRNIVVWAFSAALFCLLPIQSARADCAEIKKDINSHQTAFLIAKNKYLQATKLIVEDPRSHENISLGIASGGAMKEAIDALVDVLGRSITEGCFSGDTTVWRDVIAEMKAESAAIGKTIQTYLEMQADKAPR